MGKIRGPRDILQLKTLGSFSEHTVSTKCLTLLSRSVQRISFSGELTEKALGDF